MINKNGFSAPLHPYQIISWIIYFWHTVEPPLLILPYQVQSLKIVFLILFYISHIGVFIYGYKATKSNPTIKITLEPL